MPLSQSRAPSAHPLSSQPLPSHTLPLLQPCPARRTCRAIAHGLLALGLALWLSTAAHAQGTAPASAPQPAVALPAGLADLDAYIEGVRETFQVPGIAVAIVKDGQIVLARGWGVRALGDGAGAGPVEATTQFAIASNTKAITATVLIQLAEEGKLSLDDRVIDHLPWFRMADPAITAEMRIRDLLVHRSGLSLGAGDLLYWPTTDLDVREVVRRLRHVPIQGGFRDRYAYDNILYAVAQVVIEEVDGRPFAEALQARIFDPLGMTGVRYNHDHLRPGDRAAIGYALADGRDLQPAPPLTWHNAAGAGGLYASAEDMAKWIRVQLAGGAYRDATGEERRLFEAMSQHTMWSVATPMAVPPAWLPGSAELKIARAQFAGYGLGWSLSDFRGQKIVWHTGGWPGMVSRVTLMPGRDLGVVVLTNAEIGGALNAVTLRVLDAYLDAPPIDWTAAYAAALAKSRAAADDSWAKHVAARAKGTRPSRPLSAYAGTWRDPWYGDVALSLDKGRLRMRFTHTPSLTGTLEHWQHDSFIVRWDERWLNADAFVSFSLDEDGRPREARMKAVSPNTDFSFDFHDLKLSPAPGKTR